MFSFQSGKYVLGALDFHWGTSEHSMAGKKENIEIHLIHFNIDFGDLETALENEGAVLAVAIMFRVII